MARIDIPIDASGVPQNDRGKQRVRVAVKYGDTIHSEVVSVDSGKADVSLNVEARGPVTIAVGPEKISAAELFRRDTPTVAVKPRTAEGQLFYHVQPIVIAPHLWLRWLVWCRQYTISGYVYGPDGNPVPSANVSAFDVERFWWWSSTQQLGSTVMTDPTGYFTITFERCCGWLPWYWWELQEWRLDPILHEKIQRVLQLVPDLRVSKPSPAVELSFTLAKSQPRVPGVSLARRSSVAARKLTPSTLGALRDKLTAVLPQVPEFERLCLWPWCRWEPWFDCDADVIFKVTQSCGGLETVILDENVLQAREDIPTNFNVTLTTSAQACTIPPDPGQPEGDCFLFTNCCGVEAASIGLTCDPLLAGLADPGTEDRPFTGTIVISGQFGTSATADYYGVTYRPAQGCAMGVPPVLPAFQPVPAAALQSFTRTYFDATQMYPHQWSWPSFAPTTMLAGGSPVTVYESRHFYEAQNPPANWGNVMTGRSWTGNVDVQAVIQTASFFTDGAYEFQIVGYTRNNDGTLTAHGPLAGCGLPDAQGVNNNNQFALRFANPIASQTQPDAVIAGVKLNGNPIAACGIQHFPVGTPISLEVDFTASDAEGFLDSYDLTLQWGTNPPTSLPTSGAGVMLSGAGGEYGPTYALARAQGATEPFWSGGDMKLTIADPPPPPTPTLFPQSCAYELVLSVYKRNIVNCDLDDYYQHTAYYSFTVIFDPLV
jgi:hypothetical protein